MNEKVEKEPEKPGEEGLLNKARKLVDKADDFIEEKVEKVKERAKKDDPTREA